MLFRSTAFRLKSLQWPIFSRRNLMSVGTDEKNHRNLNPNWIRELNASMQIFPNFITTDQENCLLQEIEPYMKRLKYESTHWDNAIREYRETEKSNWNPPNLEIIHKIRDTAFPSGTALIGPVHVLDLAADGEIKPHVDSIRFCGDTIAGLSLLSDCVMRLAMVDHGNLSQDFLLQRRSLYIMSGTARYQYTHQVLGLEDSMFRGIRVPKSRRISIICRSKPNQRTG